MSARTTTDLVEETAVKRLLRHRGSRSYFKHGGWTANPAEADSFSDVVEVAQVCVQYGLRDVELALRYSAGASDLFCTPIC
jgi:hypothetical protein